MNPGITKYLQHYGHADMDAVRSVTGNYSHCVVIPMFDEPQDCLVRIFNRLDGIPKDVLVIAVVNAPDSAEAGALKRTQTLLSTIQNQTQVLAQDYCQARRIPHKEGVGLARKIGTDTALALYQVGSISNPCLFQTDADAQLPTNYFDARPEQGQRQEKGAMVFAHQHQAPAQCPSLAQAAGLYDQHMRYYTDGLAKAGSPYAYPTLGSTLAIHADSYAQVRGYPRRNAGEDFYLLNKVAKVGGVTYQPDVVLTLDARLSKRVPFGTGPALGKIVQQLQADPSGYRYLSYHPNSFALLSTALNYLDTLAHDRGATTCPDQAVEHILHGLNVQRVRNILHTKYPDLKQRQTVLTHWFDAFRTLRFVHEARHFFPDQPLLESLS